MRHLNFVVVITMFCLEVCAQTCKIPFSIRFSERTVSSVKISWSDTNTDPSGWEIELIKKGEIRTGIPTTPLISSKEYTFTNLTPSTAYEVYIRTVCHSNTYSLWNVAIPFVTVLSIPSACQLNIPLKDNGTEIFLLDVNENGILGKDVFFDGIDLIVSHEWPADLKITLESPQGQQVTLANHIGTVKDDFGDINDNNCKSVTSFAPGACLSLKESSPPFIGSFRPDGDMEMWKLDTLSKGYWKLIFFDRALKDIGTLKYVNIRFNKEKCLLPEDLTIISSNVNSINVGWKSVPSCNTVKITIKKDNIEIRSIFAECSDQSYTFNNLFPNSVYEISISGICSDFSQSPESCSIYGNTTCEPVSISENFDASTICEEGCNSVCLINSSLWFNTIGSDLQNWLVWKGKTDTDFTGPSGDINGTGNYIYVENNPLICPYGNEIILQSKCIEIMSNSSLCDMSFYYHMHGEDITFLSLEISVDGAITWNKLFHIEGNQGDEWKRVTLSLREYSGKIAVFRFVTQAATGPLSDIALDQIEFYKSIPVTSLNTYYPDADGDGYGVELGKIIICNSNPPFGFSSLLGDCDDSDPKINPASIEIPCNTTDENCNGNADDAPDFNPITYLSEKKNASCNGSRDGSITLDVIGGTPPYDITWNNQNNGSTIFNLDEGVYFATITDAGGCQTRTDFFEIKSATTLNIIFSSSKQPSCRGASDGFINIEHSTNNPPFTYNWSNGSSEKNLLNIPNGLYSVTVTDQLNCSAKIENIELKAPRTIVSDIKSIKHPLCFGSESGQVEIIVFGGIQPYTYQWNTGRTNELISNLGGGNYTCTITDLIGCKDTLNAEIQVPSMLDGKVLSTESVRCYGESNGSIKTNVIGGKPPYTYLWNNFDFTDDIFNLSAGSYTLTITDSNGCSSVIPNILINQPPSLQISIDSTKAASCILGKNGFLSLNTTGGNGGYNYVWNHTNESLPGFSNLISGNYSVTAYDKLGCKASIPNIFIPYENINVDVRLEITNENKCYLDKNGKIKSQIENGIEPFDYNWSHGVQYFSIKNFDTISLLPAGTYKLTITDKDGCTGISNTISLAEKQPYLYTTEKVINNICNSDTNGQIVIKVSGGKSPVSVEWLEGLYTGESIDGLTNGVYSGIIKDIDGCILQISPIILSSVSDIKIDADVVHDINHSSTGEICISLSGGVPPYVIVWNSGLQNISCLNNIEQGMYSVTVSDQLNCILSQSFIVQNISNTSDHNKQIVKLYPNPTTNLVNVISEEPIQSIKVYDNNGLLVKYLKEINKSELMDLDLENLPSGLYFIHVGIYDKTVYLKLKKL